MVACEFTARDSQRTHHAALVANGDVAIDEIRPNGMVLRSTLRCEDAIVEAARRLKHPTRSAPQPNLVVHVAQATRPVEEPLEDGEDLGSGSLGPGERVDDRPISMLLPTNTDHDVDDLSGHVGR